MIDLPNLTLEEIDRSRELDAGFYIIEPKVAAAIMATRNGLNRPIRDAQVTKFVSDIQNGRFQLNGESIIFAPDGQLNDGQHRLTACAKSGIPIMSLVAFGLVGETIGTVDQGVARRTGDVLAFAGVANASTTAAVARLLVAFRASAGKSAFSQSVSSPEISEFVSDHPEVIAAVAWAEGRRKFLRGVTTASLLASVKFILDERYGEERVAAFLDRVVYGENIARGQPAFATRARLMSLRPKTVHHMLEIFLRGWLAELRGVSITTIPVHGELPHLIDEKRREVSLEVRRRQREAA
jgi:hypothetical protein